MARFVPKTKNRGAIFSRLKWNGQKKIRNFPKRMIFRQSLKRSIKVVFYVVLRCVDYWISLILFVDIGAHTKNTKF